MKNIKYVILIVVLGCLIFLLSGCGNGTETIKVEYLPGSDASSWFTSSDIKSIGHQPSIAVNSLWDERQNTDRIGDGYDWYGGKTQTWVSDRNPTDIIQDALISQLEKAGFRVVKVSGWNLSPDSIPIIDTDFILSGRLKAFWVESRPGLWTVSVNSRVSFDLIIADVKTKKIIWSGQCVGADKTENVVRTNDSMRTSISRSLTQAINKVFQDEQTKRAVFTILKIKF